ncbi:putative ferric-chelate reductase 1 [Labeo rohita]|uniref:putative ferric-chelate reductase 1 n=1 Tax=Labeo rohita TaxID=84645 RepID=UPI0021E3092C|nr:putative ferric-chelate reductase 1 [Labeo rohita]
MHVEILLLLCVCCVRRVTAYPGGQVENSCESMTPNHPDFEPQTDGSPYKVFVNSTTFTPGQTITVTLQAAENTSEFQGFMLQAREVHGKTAVGRFTLINTNQSRALNCFNIENSTLSQASADKKSQFEATWEAPANSSLDDIQFFVTFVKDYTAFWTMVNSSTVRSIGNQSAPSTSPSPNKTTSTTIKPPAASQQTSSLPNSSHKQTNLSAMWLGVILHALILHSLFILSNL